MCSTVDRHSHGLQSVSSDKFKDLRLTIESYCSIVDCIPYAFAHSLIAIL